eukprot:3442296-Rhodomonas_salina.1
MPPASLQQADSEALGTVARQAVLQGSARPELVERVLEVEELMGGLRGVVERGSVEGRTQVALLLAGACLI